MQIEDIQRPLDDQSTPIGGQQGEKGKGAGPLHDLCNPHKSSGASTWAQPLILWKVEYTFTTFYE